MATIPIAMFRGIYMRYIRPGRIGEISLIGVLLLLGSIWLGGQVAADPVWAEAFTFTGVQITWMLIGYGFVAAVLPIWLILAPRDYLSTFLKIGTIVALAIGIDRKSVGQGKRVSGRCALGGCRTIKKKKN